MTIDEFRRDCDYIRNSQNRYYKSNERLMKYCQSVFNKCKENFEDKDFAEFLETYYDSIPSEERYIGERRRVIEHRVNVYRRLSHDNFSKYGERWVSNLRLLSLGHTDDDIAHFENCIELYQQLERKCGCDENCNLANCYCHLAQVYLKKRDDVKCLQYLSEAFEAYRRIEDTFNIAATYYDFGVAYYVMGRKDEAIESLFKAIEAVKRNAEEDGSWEGDHEGMTDDCISMLKIVLLDREIPPQKRYFM